MTTNREFITPQKQNVIRVNDDVNRIITKIFCLHHIILDLAILKLMSQPILLFLFNLLLSNFYVFYY